LQIAIYKNGQIIAILQIIKNPLYREFLKFIKTAKLLKFGKLQFIKTAKLLQFCKLLKFPSIGSFEIYKNGKLQFIKTAKLLQFGKFLKFPSKENLALY
jgi:hypothetical protein